MPVDVDTSDLRRIFDELTNNAKNVPMGLVAMPFVSAVETEIQTEGQGQWKPFSETTLRMKPRRRGGKLLQDTGRLASIQVDDQNAVGIAIVFSPADYAWKHSDGYKNIPQRDPFDIDLGTAMDKASMLIVQEIVAR